jgi:hypothetical protein
MLVQTSQQQFKQSERLVIGMHLLRRRSWMPFEVAHSLLQTMRDDSRLMGQHALLDRWAPRSSSMLNA